MTGSSTFASPRALAVSSFACMATDAMTVPMRGTTAAERSTDLGLLAVAICAVSFSGPLVREAAAPALALAFWRNGLSSAVLVPITAVRHSEEARRTTASERKIVVLAGLFLAAHFATWIPSLSYT